MTKDRQQQPPHTTRFLDTVLSSMCCGGVHPAACTKQLSTLGVLGTSRVEFKPQAVPAAPAIGKSPFSTANIQDLGEDTLLLQDGASTAGS